MKFLTRDLLWLVLCATLAFWAITERQRLERVRALLHDCAMMRELTGEEYKVTTILTMTRDEHDELVRFIWSDFDQQGQQYLESKGVE